MNPYKAFIEGYKPAYLCSHRYEQKLLVQLIEMGYPNVLNYELEDFDVPGRIFDRGTLFFQDEQRKEEYEVKSKGVDPDSREGIMLLGETLGFPPIACRYFVEAIEKKELAAKRAGFNYKGIVFVGNIDERLEIAKWLWENINIPPAEVKVTYQNETIFIEPTVSMI